MYKRQAPQCFTFDLCDARYLNLFAGVPRYLNLFAGVPSDRKSQALKGGSQVMRHGLSRCYERCLFYILFPSAGLHEVLTGQAQRKHLPFNLQRPKAHHVPTRSQSDAKTHVEPARRHVKNYGSKCE